MDYSAYPKTVVEDIVRVRRRIERSRLPEKRMDQNLLIGTWNIRGFSRIHPGWDENEGSPKRNLRALAVITEIIRRFDVVAIQEVKSDTSGIRMLIDDFLGDDWGILMSDVSAGAAGNAERLSFLYDRRRVQLSGLAGEIVLPPTKEGDPMEQFDRTPYIVGFRSRAENFALLTAHIRYGNAPADRIGEIRALAGHIASNLCRRAKTMAEEANLIVLGDFNIEDRGENPLFREFVSTGLVVPDQLLNLRTTYDTKPKYYDQIAWFMGEMSLNASGQAGVVDLAGAAFKEMSLKEMSFRVSDHFPLWVEFLMDRSIPAMAAILQTDPAAPDPFAGVPE